MSRRLVLGMMTVCTFAAANPVLAQTFPNKPIHIVIPFEPGGPSDVIVRAVVPVMTRELGQSIVIENRAGAGGNIGVAYVARADKDGYTLVAGGSPTNLTPHFIKGLTFDPQRDLTAVAPLATSPYYLVVNKDFPANTVKELIQMARQHPGTVSYASSGIGNRPHVAGAQFGALAGVQLLHVPYKGTAPATNDLLANRVSMMFTGMATVRAHIQSGRLKVLAVCTTERDPDFPNVPTMAQAGVPNFTPNVWYGLLAPSGTPNAAKQKISRAVDKALHDPDVIKSYATLGATPFIANVAQFQKFYSDEDKELNAFFRANPAILKE